VPANLYPASTLASHGVLHTEARGSSRTMAHPVHSTQNPPVSSSHSEERQDPAPGTRSQLISDSCSSQSLPPLTPPSPTPSSPSFLPCLCLSPSTQSSALQLQDLCSPFLLFLFIALLCFCQVLPPPGLQMSPTS
jgi:hypothetical protein